MIYVSLEHMCAQPQRAGSQELDSGRGLPNTGMVRPPAQIGNVRVQPTSGAGFPPLGGVDHQQHNKGWWSALPMAGKGMRNSNIRSFPEESSRPLFVVCMYVVCYVYA